MTGDEDLGLPEGTGNDTALFEQRRTSFDAVAAAYATARPQWPEATAAWLIGLDLAGGAPAPTRRRVLDLGAGTGKLAEPLVAAGHEVIAVDVSVGMLGELRAKLPGVEVHVGGAERIPLPDGCVDAVVVGQAWHWFRPARAAVECARVLRPGGVLGIGWHVRDERVPLVAELSDLVGQPGRSDDDDPDPGLRLPALFGPEQRRRFGYRQRLTAPELRLLAASWSYVQVHPDRERILDAVEDLGHRAADPDGMLLLPHVTRCYRAVRLGPAAAGGATRGPGR